MKKEITLEEREAMLKRLGAPEVVREDCRLGRSPYKLPSNLRKFKFLWVHQEDYDEAKLWWLVHSLGMAGSYPLRISYTLFTELDKPLREFLTELKNTNPFWMIDPFYTTGMEDHATGGYRHSLHRFGYALRLNAVVRCAMVSPYHLQEAVLTNKQHLVYPDEFMCHIEANAVEIDLDAIQEKD